MIDFKPIVRGRTHAVRLVVTDSGDESLVDVTGWNIRVGFGRSRRALGTELQKETTAGGDAAALGEASVTLTESETASISRDAVTVDVSLSHPGGAYRPVILGVSAVMDEAEYRNRFVQEEDADSGDVEQLLTPEERVTVALDMSDDPATDIRVNANLETENPEQSTIVRTIRNAVNQLQASFDQLRLDLLYSAPVNADSVADMVSRDLPVGAIVITRGYHRPGDFGHGNYLVKSDVQIASDGDLIDGVGSGFLMSNGQYAVLMDRPAATEHWGITEEGVDYLSRIRALCRSGIRAKSRLKDKEFDISDVADTLNTTIDLDWSNNTLVSTGTNERIFLFTADFRSINRIDTIEVIGGLTILNLLNDPVEIEPGNILKIFSNRVINPYADMPDERAAEYMVVSGVSGRRITLRGVVIFNHDKDSAGDPDPALNPRCATMNPDVSLTLKNTRVLRKLPHTPNEYSVAIDISGYAYAEVRNIYSDFFAGQLFSNRAGFKNKFWDIEAKELADDVPDNSLGYCLVDYGSQETEVFSVIGGNVRHVFTTGALEVPADEYSAYKYGGSVRAQIHYLLGTSCSNFAADLHEDAWEPIFHKVVVYDAQTNTYSMSGGFQDRAQHTKVHDITYSSKGVNVTSNGRSILFATGSHNCWIGTLRYRGVTGRGIETYKTRKKGTTQRARVDHIIYESWKELRNLWEIKEEFLLDIGKVDVFPLSNDRGYLGSSTAMGRTKAEVAEDENGDNILDENGAEIPLDAGPSITVGEVNLWFNRTDIPNLIGSSGTLFRIDGLTRKMHATVNVYCTPNTWQFVDRRMAYIGSDNVVPPLLVSGDIDIRVYLDDYTTEVPEYSRIRKLSSDSEVTYTYKLIAGGRPRVSTAWRKRHWFEPNSEIAFGEYCYALSTTQALKKDPHFDCFFESQASTVTIDRVEAPTFEGQTASIHLSKHNQSGNPHPATILQTATNVRLEADFVMMPGQVVQMVARKLNDVLAWEIFRGTEEYLLPAVHSVMSSVAGVIDGVGHDWGLSSVDYLYRSTILVSHEDKRLRVRRTAAGSYTFTLYERPTPSDSYAESTFANDYSLQVSVIGAGLRLEFTGKTAATKSIQILDPADVATDAEFEFTWTRHS